MCIRDSGYIQLEIADVKKVVKIIKARLDSVRDGNGFGVGKVAEITAGAADHVGQQANVGRCQTDGLGFLPERVELGFANVGEDQVLFVSNA